MRPWWCRTHAVGGARGRGGFGIVESLFFIPSPAQSRFTRPPRSAFMSPILTLSFPCSALALGGPIENRARLACNIIRRIRAAVGPDYLIAAKINSDDVRPQGNTIADTHAALVAMRAAGLDAAEIRCVT